MDAISSFQEHHHFRRWFVILSASLFFLYEFIQLHMFNAIHNDLMQAFSVNASQLSNLSAMYLYADVLFLFPAGMILDRMSTRKVIITAMLICIIATAGFAFSTQYWQAASFHFLAGIGNAFCFLSCIRLASRWFPSKMLAFVTGLIVTFAFLGGLAAQIPLTLLTHHFPWRHIILLNVGLGIIILASICLFVRDFPKGYIVQFERQQKQLSSLGVWHSIVAAFDNKQNWLGGIYTSLMNLPIMILCALWGNMYLQQIHHVTDVEASGIASMLLIGSMIGCPLLGFWSDNIGLRKMPMIIGAIFSLIIAVILVYAQNLSFGALALLFFLIGFFTSTQVIAYPLISESNNRIISSTALAIASIIIMGGAAIGQNLFGIIMDHFSTGAIANGLHVYPNAALEKAMLLFPITLFIALIVASFTRETHCREINTHNQTTLE